MYLDGREIDEVLGNEHHAWWSEQLQSRPNFIAYQRCFEKGTFSMFDSRGEYPEQTRTFCRIAIFPPRLNSAIGGPTIFVFGDRFVNVGKYTKAKRNGERIQDLKVDYSEPSHKYLSRLQKTFEVVYENQSQKVWDEYIALFLYHQNSRGDYYGPQLPQNSKLGIANRFDRYISDHPLPVISTRR